MEKRFLLAGLLAASALMAACSDDDSSILQAVSYKQESEIKPAAYTGPRQIVLHGVASGEDGLQKTAIAQDGKSVIFSEGDRISLFDGNGKNCEFKSAVADGGKSAEFTGQIEKEADYYYLLYPYQEAAKKESEKKISATLPKTQVATPGTFDPAANLSVAACEENGDFCLGNIGSLLKFTTTEPLSKIVVKSNNTAGEGKAPVYPKIAGNITITFGSGGTPSAQAAADAVSSIELVPASGKSAIAAGTYYVALLSGVYSQGITIEFYKKDASGNDIKVSDTYKRFHKEINLPLSKEANCGELITANGAYIDMVYVKGGPSIAPFSIGRFEVTQRLWEAVMGANSIDFEFDGDDHPAESITYENITSPDGFLDKLNAVAKRNFRLPSSNEWELAAKGGNPNNANAYSGSNICSEVAWHSGISDKTQEVGTKKPNELGIYDMTGNVWEWTSSFSSEDNTPITRGGSWSTGVDFCRVSFSGPSKFSSRYSNVGFRLAVGYQGTHEGFAEFDF